MKLPAWTDARLTKAQQAYLERQPDHTKWMLGSDDAITVCWFDEPPVLVDACGEAKTVVPSTGFLHAVFPSIERL